MPFFFARLSPKRPDFPANMTAEEGAVMKAHAEFLRTELAAGSLVVAGPVATPGGVFGLGVFETDSIDAARAVIARDPANAVGTYEVAPMASAVARPRSG